MSPRNFITVVSSPRPRVGKTLVARLLADFHLHNGRKVAAFDINADDPALSQFLPEHSAPADLEQIQGQMTLFDSLVAGDGAHKIVDVGHAGFKPFFAVARQIDLAEELRRRGLALVILFVATPDATAVEAYTKLRREFPLAVVVPVHNEVLGTSQQRDKFAAAGPESRAVHIPALAPGLRKIIDRRPFSFAAPDTVSPNVPLETHLELQRWVRKIYVEFREMELRVLLSSLQSSLNVQSQ
jgi:hypothetical protein